MQMGNQDHRRGRPVVLEEPVAKDHVSRSAIDDCDRILARSSSTSSSSSESITLNQVDSHMNSEIESMALLQQIFPGESTDLLRKLHLEHMERCAQGRSNRADLFSSTSAALAAQQDNTDPSIEQDENDSLPDDFLRLPAHFAVRRYKEEEGRWRYELVDELNARALDQWRRLRPHAVVDGSHFFAQVMHRDPEFGLGISLCEEHGSIRIYSLVRPPDIDVKPSAHGEPSSILPGDILIGINGVALLESLPPNSTLLRHAVIMARSSPDPVVLHLARQGRRLEGLVSPGHDTPSLLDTTDILDESLLLDESVSSSSLYRLTCASTPTMLAVYHQSPQPDEESLRTHSFARAMASRNLLSPDAMAPLSSMLKQFTERAREWEATDSLRVESSGHHVFDNFVSLVGVRKALCVRIVNTYHDGQETAYTILIHDIELGREWYAPVRHFRDFQELRDACVRLCPAVNHFPFPRQGVSLFGSPRRLETNGEREAKAQQLEDFLRSLCSIIYRGKVQNSMVEVAVHIQSFLGCDTVLIPDSLLPLITISPGPAHDHVEQQLKKNLQLYTYRLFLLEQFSDLVERFVDSIRSRGPRLSDIEAFEAQGRFVLKRKALSDLEQIQAFLDQLQDLVLEGCQEDLYSIASREEFEGVHDKIRGDKAGTYLDRLVREAVREQIEIEVYVPLRSVVSRWLVNGWRHEDMEIKFKIKELRKRQQHVFRTPGETTPLNWSSASTILREGVGSSTLPCVKLRAIVEAAREISRIVQKAREQEHMDPYLGADEFIPIFINCVVEAEMERPCALCVLLRSLCDRINRIAEVGYYLASFEAAIIHIQEIDLSEDKDVSHSLLFVSLGES